MTRLDCCRLRQASLNELPNSRAVNLPEKLPSARISDISPTSSRSAHDLQSIRNIFAFSFEDPDPSETQRFSDQDIGPKRAMLFSTRRKEGSRKLREIARVLRSRISRESEVSKRGSKKKSRSDASEEEIERRKELKRALHRRLEEELLQDRTSSVEGYDADAIPIETPNGTWGRNVGSGRYDPDRLQPGVGRFESPSPSLGRGLNQRHHPSNHDGRRQASASTKDYHPEQSNQGLGLQTILFNGLADDMHIPATRKNQSWITAPGQYSSTEQRFEKRSDLNSNQVEREDTSEVRKVQKLQPSRSASFFDFRPPKDRNHNMIASRYRSMQNIRHNPDSTDSASHTRDVDGLVERPSKWIRGPLKFLTPSTEIEESQYHYDLKNPSCSSHKTRRDGEIEQIGAMGFDGVDDSDKNRVNTTAARKAVSQRSVSFSRDSFHDMQTAPDAVSKLLVPSKSLSQLNTHARRQHVTNDNGSPLLQVKTRHECRDSSSGAMHLQVPDALPYSRRNVASSNYSSYNDSLASSRRSSLMKLQSLSERLDCIKNDPERKKSPSAWSSALDIPRVPSSQFTTAEIGNARRRILEAESRHASAPTARAPPKTAARILRSSSPQHGLVDMQTEPLYQDEIRPNRSFRRKREYGLKLESSGRRNSLNLDGSDDWNPPPGRQGYGYDFVTPLSEEASSLWGKAFQDHADKDSTHSKTRLGSVSQGRGRQTRLTRPRLQRGREYTSSDVWNERLQPNYMVDLDQLNRMDRVVSKSSSPGSAASWSRFPSHTRAERSFSPAGKADNVTARDFALEFEKMEAPHDQRKSKIFGLSKKRKSRTMTYGESLKSTLNRIYNIDLRRMNRGHRSSISVGGKLDYPELEILPHLSPPPQPLDEMSKRDIAAVLKALRSNSSQQSIVHEPAPYSKKINSAGTWSKMYEDCVNDPVDMNESLAADTLSVLSRSHAISDSTGEQVNNEVSPRSSAEMRTSTLDFQKSLQEGEAKAQERALQAADDAWGTLTPSLRFCRPGGGFPGGR